MIYTEGHAKQLIAYWDSIKDSLVLPNNPERTAWYIADIDRLISNYRTKKFTTDTDTFVRSLIERGLILEINATFNSSNAVTFLAEAYKGD